MLSRSKRSQRPGGRGGEGAMRHAVAAAAALLSLVAGGAARAAEPAAAPLAASLVGHTLSAVTYVPRRPGMPGGSELSRIVLQAYLDPNGGALVRVWDAARDRYSPAEWRRWSLSGSVLCIDTPYGRTCADVHVWGRASPGSARILTRCSTAISNPATRLPQTDE